MPIQEKRIKERFLKKITKKLISKYFIISVLSYIYVFSALYVLVSIYKVNKTVAFIIVYGSSYVLLYLIQLKFLFKKKHHKTKFVRYVISVLALYLTANLCYNLGLFLNINYLLSTVITIALLFPLRLFVYTFYVYKD